MLARPARFGLVGVTCAIAQLSCLTLLIHLGIGHSPANLVALIGSVQLNFALSTRVIWSDRPVTTRKARRLAQRFVGFNAASLATLLINEGVFILTDRFTHYLLAAICGIAVAAPLNYLLGHYLIFRSHGSDPPDDCHPLHLRRLSGIQ
jgi:putative flippase GtrA